MRPDLSLSRDRRHTRWAWVIASASFVILLGAAGFRSTPGVLMTPLHEEFGWSHGTISAAVSINLILFGLISPFAAALMDRYGVRRVTVIALLLVAAGSGLTVFMNQPWELLLLWGVAVGTGAGCMSGAFIATVTNRWFVLRRGLVSGILVAANAAGQLIFLPVIAWLAETHGWRWSSVVVALGALLVIPLVLLLLRDHPHDLGLAAYGATHDDPGPDRPVAGERGPDGRCRRCDRPRRTGPSGCWPSASPSAARPPTAWWGRISSRRRTTTGCRPPLPRACWR